MVTYLNKFINNYYNLSLLTEPLRQLLRKDIQWCWDQPQAAAFAKIKEVLTTAPVLRYYDVNAAVTLSVDASSTAMGACLLQNGQPVAYATRTLTETQQRYPQIEKEALAIKFACNHFHSYVYGKHLTVESDNKPLEAIFKKPVLSAPLRLQRILFDVLQYAPKVIYIKGTEIPIADALSRNCIQIKPTYEEEIEVQIVLSMSEQVMAQFVKATKNDDELQTLIKVIQDGWPNDSKSVPMKIKKFGTFREELSYYHGLVFKADKIVVPKSQQNIMIQHLHAGHPGINTALKRARQLLFWCGQATDVKNSVGKCSICQRTQRKNNKVKIYKKDVPNCHLR